MLPLFIAHHIILINLVINDAAEATVEGINFFFGIIAKVFNIFGRCLNRWAEL